jgi:hypothetical protein
MVGLRNWTEQAMSEKNNLARNGGDKEYQVPRRQQPTVTNTAVSASYYAALWNVEATKMLDALYDRLKIPAKLRR